MKYKFKPKNVCSKEMEVEIDKNNKIKKINIIGGCPGNSQGIANLLVGMNVSDVIQKLRGVSCGNRDTSCPDQLTYALEEAKNAMENE